MRPLSLVKLSFIFADMYHYTAHLLLLHYGVIMQLSSVIVYFYSIKRLADMQIDMNPPTTVSDTQETVKAR